MRNFFAKSVLVAAILSLVPVVSFASGPRVEGLGLQSDYVQDYVNIYAYPSSIVRYQNLVYGNWGIKDVSQPATNGDLPDFQDNNLQPDALVNAGRGMGAYLSLCKRIPGTWGIQLNENQNSLSPAYGAQYWDRQGNEGAVLMWGNKIGAKSALGLMVEKGGSRRDNGNVFNFPDAVGIGPLPINPNLTNGNNARDVMNIINQRLAANDLRNTWGVGAGWSVNWTSGSHDQLADLGFHYRKGTLHQDNGTTLTEENGGASWSANGRAQLGISDNSYLTPVVNVYHISRGTTTTTEATNTSTSFDNTISSFNVGVAESWVLRETDLLVLGVSYNREKVDYKDPAASTAGHPFEITYSQTPSLFGAVEVHPTHWWHVRMGAGKPVWSKLESIDHGPTDVKTTVKDSPFQYALGTGFRVGSSLDIDALVNQNFSFGAGWATSGTFEVPFSNISATYRF